MTPVPPAPAVPPVRSGFVTALGALSLALAAMGVFSGLVQAVVFLLAPEGLFTRLLADPQSGLPGLPPALAWMLAHLAGLNVLGLVLSAAFLAVSWGLLLRRDWARRGFILFLLLGVLVNLGGVALLWQMQQWILALNAGLGDAALDARMRSFGLATMTVTVVATLLLAALHFWLIHRLRAPAVRAEFGLDPDQ